MNGRQRADARAFSNFSLIGEGFMAVMAVAISLPMVNADSFERPGSSTKRLSVSPYTTRAPQEGWLLTWLIADSSVALPVPTMASASSAMGMRPEKPAGTTRSQRPTAGGAQHAACESRAGTIRLASSNAVGRTRGGVAVRHVGDELEGKLPRVQRALHDLVPLCRLESALDHHARLQDLAQQPRQNALADVRRDEGHAVACDAQVIHRQLHLCWIRFVPAPTSLYVRPASLHAV